MAQREYELKDGVILRPFGENSLIDNNNLTDTIAKFLLEQGRAKLTDFKEIKNNNNKKIKNGNSK